MLHSMRTAGQVFLLFTSVFLFFLLDGFTTPVNAKTLTLDSQTFRGVTATPTLTLSAASLSALLQVQLVDAASGAALLAGDVAVKIEPDHGAVVGPLRLEPAASQFQALIVLPQEGGILKIGSKLEDGKKRIFRFKLPPAQ